MSNKQKIKLSKIKKVISFGCSLSDYMFGTEKVYGEYVSEKLNAKYLHHGIGCGSNDRIWRRFFEYAREGTLDETTLVTIQWTELLRIEMFTALSHLNHGGKHQDQYSTKTGFPEVCEHLDGWLHKYKIDSYTWTSDVNMRKQMHNHTNNNLSDEYSMSLWKNYDYSIKNYCKLKNIPLLFIKHKGYNKYINETDSEYFNFININDIYRQNPRIAKDNSEDFAHMSTKGHELVSKKILNKIK
tara:strand:- start:4991 stop:5716 length:726 start_codon:yes stop_codon:yes gene_type:complete